MAAFISILSMLIGAIGIFLGFYYLSDDWRLVARIF